MGTCRMLRTSVILVMSHPQHDHISEELYTPGGARFESLVIITIIQVAWRDVNIPTLVLKVEREREKDGG